MHTTTTHSERPDPQEPPYTTEDEIWDFGETFTVTELLRDEGTIVLFGTKDDRTIAVEHGPAQGLIMLLEDLGEVDVFAADFQVLS